MVRSKKLNGADYLLTLLYLPDGDKPIDGRTRITKMMFIFSKEVYPQLNLKGMTYEELLPKFEPYNYGPFSRDVHEQLHLFLSIGFVEVQERPLTKDTLDEADVLEDAAGINEDEDDLMGGVPTISRYSLTDLGKAFVEHELLPLLSDAQKKALAEYKCRIVEMRLKDILSYVYRRYPDFAENSLIRDKVLGHE